MDKKYRLRNNEDFKIVYRKGKNYWNRNLGIYIMKNDLDNSRIGFSITKKFGNSVVRNRTRRRIKEIYRQNFDNIKEGYDIIIIPKKNVVDITHKQLESAMLHIFKISHILKDKGVK
ncbi:MAG: ribonuclease P protein component [Tissierellia bacterium]|nr:ribonuclease P protein component [Tissierellia bacterium]